MKYSKFGVTISLLLSISACTSVPIESTGPNMILTGTLKSSFLKRTAEVVYNGKLYQGEWTASDVTPEQLRKVGFPHRKHLNALSINLASSDGGAMRCSGLTHALQGDLDCVVDGTQLKVTLN